MAGRRWTAAEEIYLKDNWGQTSIPYMADILERTPKAVMEKAHSMKLPDFDKSGDYISASALVRTILKRGHIYYALACWEKIGFPTQRQKIYKKSEKVVRLDRFWLWAEKHRDVIDFTRMEPMALGVEPPWMASERKRTDHNTSGKRWTKEEEECLLQIIRENRYTAEEISEMIGKSPNAVKSKAYRMGLTVGPVAKKGDRNGKIC